MKVLVLVVIVSTVVFAYPPPFLGNISPMCLIQCPECNYKCPEEFRPLFCDCSCPPRCECPEKDKCKGDAVVSCPKMECEGDLIMEPCGCSCPKCV